MLFRTTTSVAFAQVLHYFQMPFYTELSHTIFNKIFPIIQFLVCTYTERPHTYTHTPRHTNTTRIHTAQIDTPRPQRPHTNTPHLHRSQIHTHTAPHTPHEFIHTLEIHTRHRDTHHICTYIHTNAPQIYGQTTDTHTHIHKWTHTGHTHTVSEILCGILFLLVYSSPSVYTVSTISSH